MPPVHVVEDFEVSDRLGMRMLGEANYQIKTRMSVESRGDLRSTLFGGSGVFFGNRFCCPR